MASDETMTFLSSLQEEDFDDDEDDDDDGFDDHHLRQPHPHNLSRLSVCTSSTFGVDDNDDDVNNLAAMCVSQLSIESFDADGELSDGKELSSDSENESGSCYSLPSTPPERRKEVKEYVSDNGGEGKGRKKNDPRRRKRRMRRERWGFEFEEVEKSKRKEEEHGESDQSGVMVITRPKGGKRSLCMDLEEVKACRDLGFELEHERMLEIPSRLSFSNSTLETSSGSNSPIANWRISAPGDDPRDVKARLKVWAQAVALASASRYST
ncbi:uncharacterized protein LOC106757748 [Vigna radiata var. radiata]|uniref:Uncharacterized protein LOC106757748 n=1 Tax=Vigna radiata var. radiata TaxID=3916 RepID=A0A1S3TQH4_VIGRR|nr:uncharacterized protein LOC106757748 [Vigna radiata var. radiata]